MRNEEHEDLDSTRTALARALSEASVAAAQLETDLARARGHLAQIRATLTALEARRRELEGDGAAR